MRILIVDDDPVSLAKLNVLLKKYGECDTALSGQEAIGKFKKAHENYLPYTLISLDIKMPDMNGQEVLEYIHRWELENKVHEIGERAKVIMVTAVDDVDNLVTAFKKGCVGYLTKPFNSEKLRNTLAKIDIREP
jgi:two-component system chemotaxis response regulator CheY